MKKTLLGLLVLSMTSVSVMAIDFSTNGVSSFLNTQTEKVEAVETSINDKIESAQSTSTDSSSSILSEKQAELEAQKAKLLEAQEEQQAKIDAQKETIEQKRELWNQLISN